MEAQNLTPKKSLWRTFLPPLLILVTIVGGLFLIRSWIGNKNVFSSHLKRGAQIEDFILHPIEGEPFAFSKLQSKVIIINFWASWCPACMLELPSFGKLWEKFHTQGLEVIGINLDKVPGPAILETRRKFQLKFPIFVDPANQLSTRWGVSGLPFTAILNKNRKVLYVTTGERNWFSEKVQEQIKKWLQSSS